VASRRSGRLDALPPLAYRIADRRHEIFDGPEAATVRSAGDLEHRAHVEAGNMGRTFVSMTETALPLEITPQDVQRRLQAGEKLALIDVREPGEFQLARIGGAELIPMRTVPAELSRLDVQADDTPLIVFCHHGVRSLNVVHWLREQGVDACQSMAGGIDRWSLEIDPLVARY